MEQVLLPAPRAPSVHEVVSHVATSIAERGPDAAAQNIAELHLVVDHQRAIAARTLASALAAEFNGNDMVTRRVDRVLDRFLSDEADYELPESA